ncbi:hypothetical protein [Nannocystis sp. SCPEA4]|uniref:hypothetical protein n=1 Tax=Nannocystis sp. SCPEA4 TaxID=2996787 RepID=UPI00226E403F|nr:hypothetical protein [Nannocystis sp. SCPEA4]MCY1058645.1 hypothetical protein [Nannocystis sp. SCPEA4]
MPIARPLALLALLTACGPESPKDTGTSTGDLPGTTTTTATTVQEPGPLTTTTATPTTTLAPTTDPSTGHITTGGGDFIHSPDGGGECNAPFGEYEVRCAQCDPWSQNCPPGQKCVPARDLDEGPWTRAACVPLHPEPAHPGEPCVAEPTHTRIIDDCDLHSICLGVDPVTLGPVCVPLCGGAPEAPVCPAGSACFNSNDGNLIPCLPTCEPLANTCPEGQLCIPDSFFDPDDLVCLTPGEAALAQQFEPCDDLLGCAAGLACADAALAVECDPQQSDGCCLPYCDLDAPACPGVMQTCQPFFGDSPPPPELAHLGQCRLP